MAVEYNDIKDYHLGVKTVAVGIGIPELDKHIRFKKNFTVVGGIGNVGKTTAWMYVLFLWAKFHPDHPRFLMFLNENDPREMAVQMIEWYNAKVIESNTQDEINHALKWVNHQFEFMKNDYKSDLDKLILKFKEIKFGENGYDKFDYDGVFIDPYNSLPIPNGYSDHYRNASKFRSLVNRLDIKVMVSMHANTEAQRKRDPETGLVKVPHIVDLEMGSMWFNRSDDSVVVHRHIQDPELKYISELHVQKIKHKRSGGEPTDMDNPINMTWNHDLAGRYVFPISKDPVPIPDYIGATEIEFDKKKKKGKK